MSWSQRIAIAVLVLLVVGGAALAIYAGTIAPPHRTYEQVVPNSRFSG